MNGYEDQPNADEFAPDANLQRSLHGLTPFVTSELQEAAVSGCGADGLGGVSRPARADPFRLFRQTGTSVGTGSV